MSNIITATYTHATDELRVCIWSVDSSGRWHLEACAGAEGLDHALNIKQCLFALQEAGWDLDTLDTSPASSDTCLTLADAVLETMKVLDPLPVVNHSYGDLDAGAPNYYN
jgi:hypothetical protein